MTHLPEPVGVLDIVRRVFPDADDERAGYLLQNHTGWPAFWATDNPRRDIIHSLRVLKRTLDAGKRPCEHCNRPANSPYSRIKLSDGTEVLTMCTRCSRALERVAPRERKREEVAASGSATP